MIKKDLTGFSCLNTSFFSKIVSGALSNKWIKILRLPFSIPIKDIF